MKTKILIYSLLLIVSACTYSVDEQTSDEYKLSQLTASMTGVEKPCFSPAGNQIYYIENTGTGSDLIKRIDIDGRNDQTVITRDNIRNFIVTDNNATILFDNVYNYPDSSGTEILITNYFGDGIKRVVDISDSSAFIDVFPVDLNIVDSLLLLDILIDDNGTLVNKVFTYDLQAETFTLVSGNLNAYAASFSPDKSRILFAAELGGNRYSINTADTTGTNVLTVYEVDQRVDLAGYSLDGFKILFSAPPTADSSFAMQIYSIATDGTNLNRITDNGVNNIPSGYSYDEKFVLYSSQYFTDNPDDYDVYIFDEEFGNEYLIMNNDGEDFGIEFSPTELKLLILSDAAGLPNLFIYDFTHMYR